MRADRTQNLLFSEVTTYGIFTIIIDEVFVIYSNETVKNGKNYKYH